MVSGLQTFRRSDLQTCRPSDSQLFGASGLQITEGGSTSRKPQKAASDAAWGSASLRSGRPGWDTAAKERSPATSRRDDAGDRSAHGRNISVSRALEPRARRNAQPSLPVFDAVAPPVAQCCRYCLSEKRYAMMRTDGRVLARVSPQILPHGCSPWNPCDLLVTC